jgi:hypothetical protein
MSEMAPSHRLTDQGARMILKAMLIAFELGSPQATPFLEMPEPSDPDAVAERHVISIAADLLRVSEKDERDLMVSRTDSGLLYLSLR